MFGAHRFGLALMVATAHLWPQRVAWLGLYSVFCFYLLSGYLMTLVLTTTYGFTPRGVGRFLANRALRIYPPYFAALFVAAAAYLLTPRAVHAVIPHYRPAFAIGDWFTNLSLLPTHAWAERWIPQSWSLPVEIWFYVFMACGLARGGWVLAVWLAFAVAYVPWTLLTTANVLLDTPRRYFPLEAAALPFALGSLACWLRPVLPRCPPLARGLVLAAFWSHMFFAGRIWAQPMLWGFYVSLGLGFLVVLALHDAAPPAAGALARLDRWLGDLAYPVFLVHFHVGALVAAAFPALPPRRSLTLLVLSVAGSTAVAWIIHRGVERPIETIRRRLRVRRPRVPC